MAVSDQPDSFCCCAEVLMLKSHVNDPQRWRDNAVEMRVLAEGMKDAATRRIMNRLADGWDNLAYRAERRAAQPDRIAVNIAKLPELVRK
jgi:hypothetical protein